MARLTRSVMAGLALLVGASCGLITGNDDEESELRRAELRWSRSGVQDYQVVVQYLCFCGYTRPVRLTIRSGNVVSRVDAETGQPVPSFGENVRDVAGLFDLIREAMDRTVPLVTSHTTGVMASRRYRYRLFQHAVDDELRVTTSGFQPTR